MSGPCSQVASACFQSQTHLHSASHQVCRRCITARRRSSRLLTPRRSTPPHVPTRPRGSQRAAPHTHPGDVDAVAEEGEDCDAGKEEAQGPDGVEVLLRVLPGIGSGWGAEGCPMVRSVSSRRHGEKSNVPQRLP